ncbi:hypothetical protein MIMGU_mgv1a007909mg [Erythranthe guttata]|uniref:Uncharacterized protein n=1 Tax=Erythranthe guttata TaxID=4155 RepID=A0A022Q142_ERYGU|nr:hypothetical protein MIMGU_mgv1a007909mg [Erythranthe guttata]
MTTRVSADGGDEGYNGDDSEWILLEKEISSSVNSDPDKVNSEGQEEYYKVDPFDFSDDDDEWSQLEKDISNVVNLGCDWPQEDYCKGSFVLSNYNLMSDYPFTSDDDDESPVIGTTKNEIVCIHYVGHRTWIVCQFVSHSMRIFKRMYRKFENRDSSLLTAEYDAIRSARKEIKIRRFVKYYLAYYVMLKVGVCQGRDRIPRSDDEINCWGDEEESNVEALFFSTIKKLDQRVFNRGFELQKLEIFLDETIEKLSLNSVNSDPDVVNAEEDEEDYKDAFYSFGDFDSNQRECFVTKHKSEVKRVSQKIDESTIELDDYSYLHGDEYEGILHSAVARHIKNLRVGGKLRGKWTENNTSVLFFAVLYEIDKMLFDSSFELLELEDLIYRFEEY